MKRFFVLICSSALVCSAQGETKHEKETSHKNGGGSHHEAPPPSKLSPTNLRRRVNLEVDILPQNRQGLKALLALLPAVTLLLNPQLLLQLLRFTTTTFLRNLVLLDAISQGR